MLDSYKGMERREFKRCNFTKPVHCREVASSSEGEAFSSIIKGMVKNLSASGILFVLNSIDLPSISNFLLLELEYHTSVICQELEKRSLIAQNKFLGKIVRIVNNFDGTSDVGVALIPKSDGSLNDISTMIKEE